MLELPFPLLELENMKEMMKNLMIVESFSWFSSCGCSAEREGEERKRLSVDLWHGVGELVAF